ncbi:ABC transporter substrate-binding protein [Demequina zhanjiangensis]|uniref:Extracellular solute-binding protein n=1 Tax=Demequina zhanjiangensis TaxID=3051659 RepID=A0ABT8FXT8_9MICO|nr:extracellular solute-binding protein [Demequina sp. SYSU T00b26]MDN4471718.1 extracellular solute-binding protein [Demequina sp. SYSU T00b26]
MTRAPRRATLAAIALTGVGALTLAACSSGGDTDTSSSGSEGSGGSEATTSTEFTYLGQTQNSTIVNTLTSLESGACSAAADGTPLVPDAIDGTTWDQQLQVLAGSDALSNMSMAAGTPSLMQDFIDAGLVLNLSEAFDELGVDGAVLPAAEATLKQLYQTDDLYALPTEYNIEGFWYNMDLFDQAGVEPPTTWSELEDAAAALDAAGIQPFIAAGSDGWPVTRLVGNYILRDLGADALQMVADGEASLTDPEYVAGADAVAALGDAGYFGPAAGSIDYNTAMNQFLTGGGAMFYMGSWALGNFNDPEQNQIGAENIGYFAFPEVEGGAGSISETPANAGIPVMFTTANYTDDIGEWVKCVAENYGNVALAESGQVTGFTVTETPADQSALTTMVQDEIASATGSVLWFEAAFTSEGTTVSQTNGGGLATGALSGAEFMELVQAANQG